MPRIGVFIAVGWSLRIACGRVESLRGSRPARAGARGLGTRRLLALEPRELREMLRGRAQAATREGIHQPARRGREIRALDVALRQRQSEREDDEPEDQVPGEPGEI